MCYMCHTRRFEISLALLRDPTTMIILAKRETNLRMYIEITKYLVQVKFRTDQRSI